MELSHYRRNSFIESPTPTILFHRFIPLIHQCIFWGATAIELSGVTCLFFVFKKMANSSRWPWILFGPWWNEYFLNLAGNYTKSFDAFLIFAAIPSSSPSPLIMCFYYDTWIPDKRNEIKKKKSDARICKGVYFSSYFPAPDCWWFL